MTLTLQLQKTWVAWALEIRGTVIYAKYDEKILSTSLYQT